MCILTDSLHYICETNTILKDKNKVRELTFLISRLTITVQHRELYLMHCGDLNGKEIQKRGAICVCIADPFCCILETNTTL